MNALIGLGNFVSITLRNDPFLLTKPHYNPWNSLWLALYDFNLNCLDECIILDVSKIVVCELSPSFLFFITNWRCVLGVIHIWACDCLRMFECLLWIELVSWSRCQCSIVVSIILLVLFEFEPCICFLFSILVELENFRSRLFL